MFHIKSHINFVNFLRNIVILICQIVGGAVMEKHECFYPTSGFYVQLTFIDGGFPIHQAHQEFHNH